MSSAKHHVIVDSPLGPITLVGRAGALTNLYMDVHRHAADPATFGAPTLGGLAPAVEQLEQYFAGQRTAFDLRIDPEGTPFQQRVWAALVTIPYGSTTTYGELARSIGAPRASRAVGMANGRNPISIILPCHRVVGADGSLVGYGGGLPRKVALLDLERRVAGSARSTEGGRPPRISLRGGRPDGPAATFAERPRPPGG